MTTMLGQSTTIACIAHRGFSSEFPENTHSAFEAALQTNCVGIELDVQLTRDEQLVIYHNRTLSLVGGGRNRVASRSLDELSAFDYGAWKDETFRGEKLAVLDEVLERYARQTLLLLEVKLRESSRSRLELMMRLLVERLQALDLVETVKVLCFDLKLLAYAHQLDPRLRCVWNQDFPAFLAPEARFLDAYSLQHLAVTKGLVDQIHLAGKSVYTFTVDRPGLLRKVLAAGVDGVMANDPIWLAEQLSAWTKRLSSGVPST